MNVKLSKDESLIKTWDYATYKKGGKVFNKEHHDVSLTLTSKRVITLDTSERGFYYREIPLDSVISVYCEEYKKNIFWLILGIILSCICLVASIALLIMIPGAGIPLLVIATLLLIFCIVRLGQGDFQLILKTNTVDGLITGTGASVYLQKEEGGGIFRRIKNFLFGKKTGLPNLKINFAEVKDMCETIGAIILDHKAE